ncbi:MAG: hypothetical protein ABI639_07505 [Thermoanaerobaculia bacterium]
MNVRGLRIVTALPLALAAFGLLVAGTTPVFAQETTERHSVPDAFYLSLMRDGKAEMLRGDAVAAKKSFRLACFGFLEQPVILAEGLVRLGLATAALNDRDAFIEGFSRLADVEGRFTVYAQAALTPEERRGFEDKALDWVTPETLRSLPVFAPLLARKNEVDLAKLSARERVKELEKRAAADPAENHWKVLLAQEELAGDRAAKAILRLEGVPDSADGGLAGCFRGRALARTSRCEEAVAPLAACAAASSDAQLAEAQLGCLLSLERFDAARNAAGRLRKPAADAAAVRKLVARIPGPAKSGGASKPPAGAKIQPDEKPAPSRPPGPTASTSGQAADATVKPPAASVTAPASTRPTAATVTGAPPPGPVKPTGAGAPPSSTSAAKSTAPSATLASLTADEERAIRSARDLAKSGDRREDLQRSLALVRPIADRLAGQADLQLLAGEIAYRAGQWPVCIDYYRRSAPQSDGPIDPTQRFYLAVCLFESGDLAGASGVASTGLEKLQRPPFVETYLRRIRASHP